MKTCFKQVAISSLILNTMFWEIENKKEWNTLALFWILKPQYVWGRKKEDQRQGWGKKKSSIMESRYIAKFMGFNSQEQWILENLIQFVNNQVA